MGSRVPMAMLLGINEDPKLLMWFDRAVPAS